MVAKKLHWSYWLLAAVFAVAFSMAPAGLAHAEGALQAAEVPEGDVVTDAPEPSQEDGWVETDAGWQFIRDGVACTSTWVDTNSAPAIEGATAGEHRYWLDVNGLLACGRVIDPETPRDEGADYLAYATKSGAIALGKTVVGNKVYLAKTTGANPGELEQGNGQGFLTTSKYDKTSQRYRIDPQAHAAITGKVITVAGWGKLYAYPSKGYIVRGVKKFDDTHVLLADAAGKLLQKKGWVTTKTYAGTSQRYYLEPTKKDKDVLGARTGLFNVKGWGKAYAFPTKGYIVRGVKKVDSTHVLVADAAGKLCQKKGWVITSKYAGGLQRYYFEPTAKDSKVMGARIGFFNVKNYGKLYAYASTGYVVRGVKKFDDTHALIADNDGKLCQKEGWVVTSKYAGGLQRYYFEPTKKNKSIMGARIGSFKVSGKQYYGLASTGYEFRNDYKQVGDKLYHADNDGVLAYHGVTTRMYRTAQGYSSPSRYLIVVDTDDTKLMVLEGSQGNWNIKYIWDCSTGAPSTPTPIGVFHVGIKGYSFGHGYTCYYYTQFYGDYLFHTRIYQEGTHILRDAAMNTMVSQGCVRLLDENAYWIWKNIPQGTTVVTIK